MKKIAAICLILPLLVLNIIPSLANATQQNVDIKFESGFGISIHIRNYNDYAIQDIQLKIVSISGLVICGIYGVTTLQEIEAGGCGYLVLPIFGIGPGVIYAVISYTDQGEYVEKQINANIFIIGPWISVMKQW